VLRRRVGRLGIVRSRAGTSDTTRRLQEAADAVVYAVLELMIELLRQHRCPGPVNFVPFS